MSTLRKSAVSMIMLLGGLAAAGEGTAPAPSFTKKPTAARDGDKVKIEFAVDRATDVAVYVEKASGEVVRHLVAGVLGPKAPEPLKAGALDQSVLWDGKDDDGKPAAGGPFKIRVGLGLKASWGGTAFGEKDQSGPNHITSVSGLAVGPDGRVYVMDNRSGWLYWPGYAVHVFRRDGAYEKTIKPFPANTPPEKIGPTRAFVNDRGFLNPVIFRTLGMTFYPYEDEPAPQMAFVDGRLYHPVVPATNPGTYYYRGDAPHLAAIDGDGAVALPGYAGPALGPWKHIRPHLVASSDSKSLFVTGFGKEAKPWNETAQVFPFVCRVPLPAAGPAQPFFGDAKQSGNDEKHLNNPRGMAVDGQGHLLVCDFGNDRIVVLKEADGSFVGSFPVKAPEWVGVHPKTGAVYVYSNRESIVKFSGWKDAKETARISPKCFASIYMGWGNMRPICSMALDTSAEPAVLWIGSNIGSPTLLRCEERGGSLAEPEPAKCFVTPGRWRPAADPTHRLVSCRVDEIDRMKGSALHVLDEATGQTRQVRTALGAIGNGQGATSRLDRDGNVYSCAASGGIWKCDASGKFVPFAATAADPGLKGHLPGDAGSTGTTAWERDWYVDRKGDIYTKVSGVAYHGMMHVDVYGPDGKLKRTALWGVTDGSYGPRVDPKGNIYMMEAIKPAGQPFPEEFKSRAQERYISAWYDWIYGSIVKFGPEGGNIWLKGRSDKDRPKAEPVKLPDSMAKVKVCASLRGDANEMQGALWMAPGVAHVGDMAVGGGGCHCHCTGCDFDVDDFGRSFAPDNGRQRVTVFDTNGNVILNFGAYGNQDYCGPESYVVDPAGKFLRPRNADDPKDLKSPFAEPEVAFNFIVGLAVTDKHAYVADCANRRMLRVKLEYAATETAVVP
jgi:DNA-binding beta-propeller fold protein YncE